MALGSLPTALEIWAEFAANSKPALNGASGYNIGSAKNQLTGSNTYNINNDFGNTGQPTASIVAPQGVIDTEAIIRGNVDWQGFEATYFFEWGAGNFNNTTTTRTTTGEELVSETLTGLSNNTNYQYRLVIYNGFNSNSADYIRTTSESFTTATPPDTTKPYNLALSQSVYVAPLEVLAEWDLADNTLGLQIQFAVNGSTYNTYTLSAGTTSYNLSDQSWVGGDEVTFRVRYTSGSQTGYSDYSDALVLIESQ